jgi:hypothetical protein
MNVKLLSAAIAPTVLCIVAAAWGWQQSRATAAAVDRAKKAEAAIARNSEAQESASWVQVEQDAALLATDLKEADRKEASKRLRDTVRRLKSKYAYPQLHGGGEP